MEQTGKHKGTNRHETFTCEILKLKQSLLIDSDSFSIQMNALQSLEIRTNSEPTGNNFGSNWELILK